MELLVVVAGWGLNECRSGEWLKSLGKLESFRKLIDILAMELEEEVVLELLVVLPMVFDEQLSVLASVAFYLARLIAFLMLVLLIMD